MSGWGNQGQQGQQGWGQGQQGQQGWQQGQQGQGQQWGGQGQQGQQWGQQGQQGQQWGGGQQGQQQWGGQQQQWGGFQPVEGQLYKLLSGMGHNLVLDVSQLGHELNKMIVWTDNNGANQKFLFRNVGNGKWGIFSAKNGMTV